MHVTNAIQQREKDQSSTTNPKWVLTELVVEESIMNILSWRTHHEIGSAIVDNMGIEAEKGAVARFNATFLNGATIRFYIKRFNTPIDNMTSAIEQ